MPSNNQVRKGPHRDNWPFFDREQIRFDKTKNMSRTCSRYVTFPWQVEKSQSVSVEFHLEVAHPVALAVGQFLAFHLAALVVHLEGHRDRQDHPVLLTQTHD